MIGEGPDQYSKLLPVQLTYRGGPDFMANVSPGSITSVYLCVVVYV